MSTELSQKLSTSELFASYEQDFLDNIKKIKLMFRKERTH